MKNFITALKGDALGTAFVIPGFSGGTISGIGKLLGQQIGPNSGFSGGSFRLHQLLAADSTVPQQLVGGGDVEGGGGEAPDFQQDALLVGSKRVVEGVGGGGLAVCLRLGHIPVLQ